MELQRATIAMLSEAMMNYDKTVVQIANMLHTVAVFIFFAIALSHHNTDTYALFFCRAPRLLISSNKSNVEDTYVHTFISYIIKLVFGIENILNHQW